MAATDPLISGIDASVMALLERTKVNGMATQSGESSQDAVSFLDHIKAVEAAGRWAELRAKITAKKPKVSADAQPKVSAKFDDVRARFNGVKNGAAPSSRGAAAEADADA